MNVWRWMSPTNEGNEEENKHEDSRLPYSSIVKGPSVKKQVISIIVILGVKDLIGDIHFLFLKMPMNAAGRKFLGCLVS